MYSPDISARSEPLVGVSVRSCTAIRAWRYDGNARIAIALADIVMFVIAALVAEAIDFRSSDLRVLSVAFWQAPVIFVIFWVMIFACIGMYRISFAMTVRDEAYITVAALLVGIVPQFILFTLVPGLTGSRLVLLMAAAVAVVLVGSSRAFVHFRRQCREADIPPKIGVAGATPDAWLRSRLDPTCSGMVALHPSVPVTMHDVHHLVERARAADCRAIYLTTVPAGQLLMRLVDRAQAYGIVVRIALDPLLTGACRFAIDDDGRGALLAPQRLRVHTFGGRMLKRWFDLVIASAMLALAAPVMIVAALAVAIESGRPIFFRHERAGRDGVPFEMLKFRSMYQKHAYGNGWATHGDPRITRVGAVLRRLSIDELPQLLNVLRGEMSIVGPRPEMLDYVERFEATIPNYADRHFVKPGITGWSQIYMKRVLTPDDAVDVLRHDLFYIQNWELFMDVSIVAKTGAEFLFHSPA